MPPLPPVASRLRAYGGMKGVPGLAGGEETTVSKLGGWWWLAPVSGVEEEQPGAPVASRPQECGGRGEQQPWSRGG